MEAEDDVDAVLSARIRGLPGHRPARSASAVLALARRRARVRRATATGLLLAAAVLLAVGLGGLDRREGVRTRGGVGALPVRVEGLAEGEAGLRPLRDGGALRAGEALVVRVIAGSPGLLSVEADGRRLWPAEQALLVDAGAYWLGGEAPLSWVPDDRPEAEHVVVARLCAPDDPERCGAAALRVRWAP